MLRGYYTSANAIINEQRIINTISHNISNVGTAGYKTENVIPTTFAENMLLVKEMFGDDRRNEGTIRYRTFDYTYTNLGQGTFEQTGSRLDMLTIGSVFFNVAERKTGETLLTKNGQFSIDAEGYLALGSSGRILDSSGREIYLGTANFQVSHNGIIVKEDGTEIPLGLTYLDINSDVERVGDNLIRPFDDSTMNNIPADYEYQVVQGSYERSNVNVSKEMVKAMDAQAVFTANSSALKTINSINQIAANDLARIN